MRPGRFFSMVWLVIFCMMMTPQISTATENSGSSDSGSNPLMEGLMTILQESIDEFIGNYKGRLGEVKLIERRGNRLVLEVTYDNVKRSDNVYVQGEVLNYGSKLEGFTNNLSSISGSHGKARLAIGWTPQGDDGWGTSVADVRSDQIRLYLVRSSNPDRPFGEIVYDLSKLWTDSDQIDEEAMTADSGAIELEDEPADSGTSSSTGPSTPSIFIKPGTVLKPHQPSASVQKPDQTVQSTPQPGTAQTQAPAAPGGVAATVKPIPAVIKGIEQYDFYANASKATWRSRRDRPDLSGPYTDKKGFVRKIAKARLNSGTNAIEMIEMHPGERRKAYIYGAFPAMILGEGVHFKAIAGFLNGANKSDGAAFEVYVVENKKQHQVASVWVKPTEHSRIDADLSQWRGKKVQLVLKVRAGRRSGYQDWAVWVKPRLSK